MKIRLYILTCISVSLSLSSCENVKSTYLTWEDISNASINERMWLPDFIFI